MKKVVYPDKIVWSNLMLRPQTKAFELNNLVDEVFDEVKIKGDEALVKYSLLFDKVKVENLKISQKTIDAAIEFVPKDLQNAIALAKSNIEKFHIAQKENKNEIETTTGVKCWRESRAIEKVGLYIPGGTAPLFSTVLMLGIPAKIAGCTEIILCTPPNKNGDIDPVILYTAGLVGITSVYAVGGIQAIASLTFGTDTISKVDKIFGPGNQFVTAAKQKALNFGVAIDMPAGPSELLVMADASCVPAFVAADLLSQAEHGADSQVVLLSDDEVIVDEVLIELQLQIEKLPRKDFAEIALNNSRAIVLKSITQCIEFSNQYAPEHLILAVEDARNLSSKITNAGSVFLGNYSCESAGDYASGTNHTLPTNGFARNYSGVSLDSFVKKITFQELSAEGIKNIGPAIELMAEAEQLMAHKNAVTLRLNSL